MQPRPRRESARVSCPSSGSLTRARMHSERRSPYAALRAAVTDDREKTSATRSRDRQREAEDAAAAGRVGDRDLAAVVVHDLAHEREPETGPLLAGGEER